MFPLAFLARRWQVAKGRIADIVPRVVVETETLDETICSRPALAAFAEWSRKFAGLGTINAHRRAIAAIYDRTLRPISVSPKPTRPSARVRPFCPTLSSSASPNREHVYREMLRRGFDIGLLILPECP